MSTPIVLFRADQDTEEELGICGQIMPCVHQYRSEVVSDSLVIGRYSVLPFYEELEKEIE